MEKSGHYFICQGLQAEFNED